MRKLGLSVTPTGAFGVSLGTGKAVQGEGECKAVMLELPGVN